MDKLSEYIPLLIILVSVLFTAIGKKKKPGKITQRTTLPGKTIEDFFDFEKEESPQPYSDAYQTFTEEEPKKQPIYKTDNIQEKASSFSSAPLMLELEEDDSHFSFEDEEDVKKAIIYAEIINRKEY